MLAFQYVVCAYIIIIISTVAIFVFFFFQNDWKIIKNCFFYLLFSLHTGNVKWYSFHGFCVYFFSFRFTPVETFKI